MKRFEFVADSAELTIVFDPPHPCEILGRLYLATNGPVWSKAKGYKWMKTRTIHQCCQWEGITCVGRPTAFYPLLTEIRLDSLGKAGKYLIGKLISAE